MTLWWVIFNHPEHCEHGQSDLACGEGDLFDGPDGPTGVEPSCIYANSSLAGGHGQARFTDRLAVGEARDSCIDFFEPGATHVLAPGECSDLQFAVFPATD